MDILKKISHLRRLLSISLLMLMALPIACERKFGSPAADPGYVPPTPTPACLYTPLADITSNINGAPITGNTCGHANLFTDQGRGELAPDDLYFFRLSAPATVTVSLCGGASWDTYLFLRSCCYQQSSDLAYDDDYCGVQSQFTVSLSSGSYYLIIDGFDLAVQCGDYSIALTD